MTQAKLISLNYLMLTTVVKAFRFFHSTVFAVLLFCSPVFAQVYPIQTNIQLLPPYTPYFADYTAPGAQRLMVQLRPNDINLSDYSVKLRITIDGVGITLRTKPTMVSQPIALQGGVPLILYGEDIREYFDPINLDFAGISRTEFEKTGKLPEGVYRFSVEVLDFNRNTLVSNKGITVAWIVLNDPPLLNLPSRDTKIRILDPTNIPFTWTPRHTGSPNSAFNSEYVFRIVEIWPAGRNAYDAFLSQPPLYEVTTSQTQIVYGLAEPALLPGRKYAWQVQAVDTDGRDLFKNQGRSEVYVFQYGDELGVPENFRKEMANSSTISVRWDPSSIGEMPDQYRVRYKAANSESWAEVVTAQSWTTLPQLQPNTAYTVQVRAEKERRTGEYTTVQRINTAELIADANFSCGQPIKISLPQLKPALSELRPGDIFTCADFSVIVSDVTKAQDGNFEGLGRMKVNLLNYANVEVMFSGTIDTTYTMLTGQVESTYQKGSAIASLVNEMKKIAEEKKEEPKPKTDSTKVTRPPDIVVPGVIDSVYVNPEGKIVVIDEQGKESTYEPKKDGQTGEVKETVIADDGGNTYVVQKDLTTGETKVTKVEASGGTITAANLAGAVSGGKDYLNNYYLLIQDIESSKFFYCSGQPNVAPEVVELFRTQLSLDEPPTYLCETRRPSGVLKVVAALFIRFSESSKKYGAYMSYKNEKGETLSYQKAVIKLNDQNLGLNEAVDIGKIPDGQVFEIKILGGKQGESEVATVFKITRGYPELREFGIFFEGKVVKASDQIEQDVDKMITIEVREIKADGSPSPLSSEKESIVWAKDDTQNKTKFEYKVAKSLQAIEVVVNGKPTSVKVLGKENFVAGIKLSEIAYVEEAKNRIRAKNPAMLSALETLSVGIEGVADSHVAFAATKSLNSDPQKVVYGVAQSGTRGDKLFTNPNLVIKDQSGCILTIPVLKMITNDDLLTISKAIEASDVSIATPILAKIAVVYPDVAESLKNLINNGDKTKAETEKSKLNGDQKLVYRLSDQELSNQVTTDPYATIYLNQEKIENIASGYVSITRGNAYNTLDNKDIMEGVKSDNSAQGTVRELILKQYTLILAHEMMHVYFKMTNKVDAFKWSLVKESSGCYPGSGKTYCSSAFGHEKNNPDGMAACVEQGRYPPPNYTLKQ